MSTLGNRGSKSSDLSHSEFREKAKFSAHIFDDLTLTNCFRCTVKLNTQKGRKALDEINATSLRILRFSIPLSIMNYSLSLSLFSLVSKAFIYMCLEKFHIIFSFKREL